uniref:Ankyrin 2,3/unc44-like protein n=1 Tax=uncultured bacterium FLS12 TaxID=651659 RepID=C5HLB7_9BACT|nr:ankyrin 2,3/unc44-like protein [uncultured bacterium FLS12]
MMGAHPMCRRSRSGNEMNTRRCEKEGRVSKLWVVCIGIAVALAVCGVVLWPLLSSFHRVCALGVTSMVKFHIDHGVNVDGSDSDMRRPLMLAARNGDMEVVALLLDAGADVNARGYRRGKPWYTALHEAVSPGHLDIVKILLEHGANVDGNTDDSRRPLMLASWEGHTEIVQLLLEAGADVNARGYFEGKERDTALHQAAFCGYLGIVKALVENGAALDIVAPFSGTPLHQAAFCGHTNVIQYLLDHGANKEAIDDRQKTPLLEAVSGGKLPSVRLLVENGADLYAMNDRGNTPLHEAAGEGKLDIVEYLLEAGCDPNVKGKHGLTPLDYATMFSRTMESIGLPRSVQREFQRSLKEMSIKQMSETQRKNVLKVMDLLQEKTGRKGGIVGAAREGLNGGERE